MEVQSRLGTSHPTGTYLVRCSDGLQWAVAGVAIVLALRGGGSSLQWVALALFLPIVLFACRLAYRRRIIEWYRAQWSALRSYSTDLGPIPWRASVGYVTLPLALFLLVRDYAIVSGDSRPAVLAAASLITDGNWELGEFVDVYVRMQLFTSEGRVPYFFRQASGGFYSWYPSGMVPFVLPNMALARLSGADLISPQVHARVEKWTAAAVAASSLTLFFIVALRLVEPWHAWVATIVLGTGSAMFSTVGQALWQHGGVIFWSLSALLVEFQSCGRPTPRGMVLQGISCAMMLACRLSSVTFIGPFFAWRLLRSPRTAFLVASFAISAYVPWALLYSATSGSILGPGVAQMAVAAWTPRIGDSLLGVLASPGRGVIIYQPWILLLGLALIPSFRQQMALVAPHAGPTGWSWFCACAILSHLLLISGWRCWWGGYCWGSRLAAEIIPLCALLCLKPIALLWSTRPGRWVLVSLGMFSCSMHVPAVYLRSGAWNALPNIDRYPARLWSWSDPPFLHPLLHR